MIYNTSSLYHDVSFLVVPPGIRVYCFSSLRDIPQTLKEKIMTTATTLQCVLTIRWLGGGDDHTHHVDLDHDDYHAINDGDLDAVECALPGIDISTVESADAEVSEIYEDGSAVGYGERE